MSASAAMGSFASRQRAAEGHYFNTEGQLAVMRHLEKLVQQASPSDGCLASTAFLPSVGLPLHASGTCRGGRQGRQRRRRLRPAGAPCACAHPLLLLASQLASPCRTSPPCHSSHALPPVHNLLGARTTQGSPVPGLRTRPACPSNSRAPPPRLLQPRAPPLLSLQGKVDSSVLEAAQRAAEEAASSGLPTEVVTKRSEYVYQHKPGLVPGEHSAGGAVQGKVARRRGLGWVGAALAGLAGSAAALRATRAASLVAKPARLWPAPANDEHPTRAPLCPQPPASTTSATCSWAPRCPWAAPGGPPTAPPSSPVS